MKHALTIRDHSVVSVPAALPPELAASMSESRSAMLPVCSATSRPPAAVGRRGAGWGGAAQAGEARRGYGLRAGLEEWKKEPVNC
jgi:hypothetical protein